MDVVFVMRADSSPLKLLTQVFQRAEPIAFEYPWVRLKEAPSFP